MQVPHQKTDHLGPKSNALLEPERSFPVKEAPTSTLYTVQLSSVPSSTRTLSRSLQAKYVRTSWARRARGGERERFGGRGSAGARRVETASPARPLPGSASTCLEHGALKAEGARENQKRQYGIEGGRFRVVIAPGRGRGASAAQTTSRTGAHVRSCVLGENPLCVCGQ